MTRCEQPGCPGSIDETGFCAVCGVQPLPAESTRPVTIGGNDELTLQEQPTSSSVRSGIGYTELPSVEEDEPDSQALTRVEVPESHRVCGKCGRPVGRSRLDQPAVSSGFCQGCGTKFSFAAKLHEGDRLGQYEVVRPLAHGGVGWVYLAKDTHLNDRPVALKGLINENDPKTAEAAVNEKKHLIALDHENIVRIIDFVIDHDRDPVKPTGYIVMEYVGGKSLQLIKTLAYTGTRPLHVEDIVKYGLHLLDALAYLHARDLVYCDLKPDNAIHQRRRVKLIDLGATCERGFTGDVWVTEGYTVSKKERTARGMQPDMDLYSLGKTLDSMLVHSKAGLTQLKPGIDSLRLTLDRATQKDDWRLRFSSAVEMSEQLDGVLRQLTALRDVTLPPKPSARFAAGLHLLDDGLGAPPRLERWTSTPASEEVLIPESLAHGRPEPPTVAQTLPGTLVDPTDPAAGFLATVTTEDPRRLLAELDKFGKPSAEVEFARVRAHLALGDATSADKALRRTAADWRLHWHGGLLALHRRQVDQAAVAFASVRRILPGELVPRLALGYCAEYLGMVADAAEHYDVVWRTDQAEVSAAFGLARTALARSDRDSAVHALDAVPPVSKFYDAARIAAIRVCAGRIGNDKPDAASLMQAVDRLRHPPASGPDHARLVAAVRQAALDLVRRQPLPDLPDQDVLGRPATEHGVRLRLERSFRDLAGQSRTDDHHGTLIDLANTVRPRTRW